MFGISGTELFIIVVFVLLIFGPDKLPQFGRTIGQFMREFKRAQDSMEAIIRAEVHAGNKKPSVGRITDLEPDDEDEDEEEESPPSATPPKRKSAAVKATPEPDDDEEEDEE